MILGSPSIDTKSVNTEETYDTTSTSDTLAADDDDPDILAFGFQEVDLSTEALLYSTSTAREDAWCMAIFAGLGEKAVLYEKVHSILSLGVLCHGIDWSLNDPASFKAACRYAAGHHCEKEHYSVLQ